MEKVILTSHEASTCSSTPLKIDVEGVQQQPPVKRYVIDARMKVIGECRRSCVTSSVYINTSMVSKPTPLPSPHLNQHTARMTFIKLVMLCIKIVYTQDKLLNGLTSFVFIIGKMTLHSCFVKSVYSINTVLFYFKLAYHIAWTGTLFHIARLLFPPQLCLTHTS